MYLCLKHNSTSLKHQPALIPNQTSWQRYSIGICSWTMALIVQTRCMNISMKLPMRIVVFIVLLHWFTSMRYKALILLVARRSSWCFIKVLPCFTAFMPCAYSVVLTTHTSIHAPTSKTAASRCVIYDIVNPPFTVEFRSCHYLEINCVRSLTRYLHREHNTIT